jgi:hypothetical protein
MDLSLVVFVSFDPRRTFLWIQTDDGAYDTTNCMPLAALPGKAE